MSLSSHGGSPRSGAPGKSRPTKHRQFKFPPSLLMIHHYLWLVSTSTNQLPVVTTTGSLSGASMLSPIQLQQIACAVADILCPSSMANPLAATAPSPMTVSVTGILRRCIYIYISHRIYMRLLRWAPCYLKHLFRLVLIVT